MRRITKIKAFGKIWTVKEYGLFDVFVNYRMTKKEFLETMATLVGVGAICVSLAVLPYIIESIVK